VVAIRFISAIMRSNAVVLNSKEKHSIMDQGIKRTGVEKSETLK